MNLKHLFLLVLIVMVFSSGVVFASDLNSTDNMLANNTISVGGDDSYDGDSQLLNDCYQNTLSSNESSKNNTELTPSSNTAYPQGQYSVVLKDSNSTALLVNKTVTLLINNVRYNSSTNNNGVASFNLNLNPGKYSLTVNFAGDDDYEPVSLVTSVNVLTTVTAKDISKYYKSSTQYSARFYDNQGKYLANTWVTITINGKSYNKKTNSAGLAYMPMNFKPGTYKIVAINPSTGYRLSTTFKILSTITASTLNHVQGDSKKVKVKFFKSNGKVLAKKYIKYKLKGKTYKVKTSSKGIISLSVKKFKKGTYKFVCYNKDGLSKTYKIKIFKRKASTKLTAYSYTYYSNQTKKLVIKFSTKIGENSASGKTIKITLNGKTYSKKTDSNGIINFNLPSLKKGLYTVKYTYSGDKFFKSSTTSKLLTIIDTRSTALSVKSTKSFGYGAGTLFKVLYSAGGVPLVKKTVTFTVNGKNYGAVTDNSGIASIPIDLNIGEYVVSYKTGSDSKVDGTNGSCNIDVFKRSSSKIVWKCGSSYKDSGQIFKVLITNSDGKAVSGGSVELIIDSEKYTGTVSSSGYATVKTEVAIGKYKVSVKYSGNNNYLSSSSSKTVNVKLSNFGNGINQKYGGVSSAYLKSSSYCKVGSAKIKKLVKSLTSGLTNKIDKAKAIFNYVRDTLSYSYYYNSKYGATKTLKLKKGNCADHSHLLVSMFRTAGFKARYIHGKCHFSDGDVTGHVWTQVKIGKYWVCADAVSYRNSLGKIKNWNTKSYTLHAKYRSLPF